MRLGTGLVVGVLGFLLTVMMERTADAAGPSQAEIDTAIARGVSFLREHQEDSGAWFYNFNPEHALGMTSLVGLALLENGIDAEDPAIQRAERLVRERARESTQTYDVSLAILFLARVQKSQNGENDALIRRLGARLANGDNDGLWTYDVPLDAPENDDPPTSLRTRRFDQGGDNSNTQFALLGLWAAGRHGFNPNRALAAIDRHFRRTRDGDGVWGYVPGDNARDAMTCAGLMGLAIPAARPELAERQTARARGVALAADPVFQKALKAVSRQAKQINGGSDPYYLWSLERVCVALGLRDLEGFDWYAKGAEELVRRQSRDGSWPHERWGIMPNTCLALLFLRKANLAFELDRVLKLPSKNTSETVPARPAVEAPLASRTGGDGDEASVTVTSASDAGFPEIAVDFEVKRPDDSYILDATLPDFKVTEDGQPVEVLRLQAPTAREGKPITVVLVVDRSLSMEEENRIGELKKAVATFLQGLPKGSRVAVIAFGSDVSLVSSFTSDFASVQTAVSRLKAAGATRYYDAVEEALEILGRETGRRAVLALTDGEDTFSQSATLEKVTLKARKLGIPVHTLGLGSEDEIASDDLRALASSTRGQYYPATQAEQLRAIYEQIAERLRSGYSLVYRSDRRLPDGTLRPIRVTYRLSKTSGVATVFIPGMVVPASGWSKLFLGLILGLGLLSMIPSRLARRRTADASPR